MISPKSTRSNRARYRRLLELRVVVLRQKREESCAQLAGACLAERPNTSVFYEGPLTGHVICLPRMHASFAMCPARAAATPQGSVRLLPAPHAIQEVLEPVVSTTWLDRSLSCAVRAKNGTTSFETPD
jgi:hypothetical protein